MYSNRTDEQCLPDRYINNIAKYYLKDDYSQKPLGLL